MPINTAPLARKDLKLLKRVMQSVPSLPGQGQRTPMPLNPISVHLNQESGDNLFNIFLKAFTFPPHSAVAFPWLLFLLSLVFVGSSHHSPEPFPDISNPLCYPSMACVKASFWQKHWAFCFLPLFVALSVLDRSGSMFPYTGICMLMSEVSLDTACICQNAFLLLRSWHGRGSCL